MPIRDAILRLGCVAAGACCASTPALAQSSAAWPGVAADAMNPVPVIGAGDRDPAGLSPYRLPASRTPSGQLYEPPYLLREPQRTASGWELYGFAEAGVLLGDAHQRNALFRRYRDIDKGFSLQRFDAQALKPDQARFIEIVGGSAGRRDQFYGLKVGRYNDYRISLSFNETPHIYSTSARPIWQGVGTGTLTLPLASGVAAGGASTNNATNAAAVQRLIQQTADTELGVTRRTGAARIELRLGEGWTFLSSYAIERRQGARAFGGNEGNGETVEPVDYRTHDLHAGLQFADDTSHFNLALSASLFRNSIDSLRWENPFQHPVGALRILGGRADLVPDNEAYNAKLEYARALPALWRGRFTATVELGAMRQNERLIPPTVTSGIGAPFGTGFNGNFDLWNTTAALSQAHADARIDTRLVDLGLSLAPARGLTVRSTLRHRETRNGTRYTAFNPQTEQYGYIIQDTNASRIFSNTNNVHYRSIPFAGAQDNLKLGGEYQVRRRAVLSAELERENFRRDHRERERTWEDRLRLGYTDRGFESLTVRLSYEQANRRGSDYLSNPYRAFYTESLPAYTVTTANLLDRLHNLEELRKFDLADRRQQVLRVRLNHLPRADVDLGVTLQSKTNKYPADFGRTGVQAQHALNLDAGYLPTPVTAVNAYYSRQWSKMQQSGAADLGSAGAAGCLGLPPRCSNAFGAPGSIYPAELAWSAASQDRSSSFGLGLRHDFGRPKLELQYTQVSSRSPLGYAYASVNALQSPAFAAQAADGFADITYAWRALDAGLRLPMSRTIALRLFYRHEIVRISDWHYSGLDPGIVVGNRVYLDAGPANYRVDLFGVLLQFTL